MDVPRFCILYVDKPYFSNSGTVLTSWFVKISASFPPSLVSLLYTTGINMVWAQARVTFYCLVLNSQVYKSWGWSRPLEGCSANPCSESALAASLRVLSSYYENVQARRNEREHFVSHIYLLRAFQCSPKSWEHCPTKTAADLTCNRVDHSPNIPEVLNASF